MTKGPRARAARPTVLAGRPAPECGHAAAAEPDAGARRDAASPALLAARSAGEPRAAGSGAPWETGGRALLEAPLDPGPDPAGEAPAPPPRCGRSQNCLLQSHRRCETWEPRGHAVAEAGSLVVRLCCRPGGLSALLRRLLRLRAGKTPAHAPQAEEGQEGWPGGLLGAEPGNLNAPHRRDRPRGGNLRVLASQDLGPRCSLTPRQALCPPPCPPHPCQVACPPQPCGCWGSADQTASRGSTHFTAEAWEALSSWAMWSGRPRSPALAG